MSEFSLSVISNHFQVPAERQPLFPLVVSAKSFNGRNHHKALNSESRFTSKTKQGKGERL